jgi:hypothetical protein
MNSVGSVCSFCEKSFSKEKLYGPNNERYKYCNTCRIGDASRNVRYEMRIADQNTRNYMAGLFEAFVLEIESSKTKSNGYYTFDGLIQLINNSSQSYSSDKNPFYFKMLSYSQAQYCKELVYEWAEKFGDFVDRVLNQNQFYDATGKPPTPLLTVKDWHNCIIRLFQILKLADNGVVNIVENFMYENAMNNVEKGLKAIDSAASIEKQKLINSAKQKKKTVKKNKK